MAGSQLAAPQWVPTEDTPRASREFHHRAVMRLGLQSEGLSIIGGSTDEVGMAFAQERGHWPVGLMLTTGKPPAWRIYGLGWAGLRLSLFTTTTAIM